jgi:c-di-GMP-binding flagellar brake protein YcgR
MRMKKIEQKEKRKYIRLPAYHLVKYRLLSKEREYGATVVTGARDIGGGGVCLEVKEGLPVSSILELLINFPSIAAPVACLAKVVWARKMKSTKNYRVGIEFLEIDDTLRAIIMRRIEGVRKVVNSGGRGR